MVLRWMPYFQLMRLDKPIGSWLLFLPGLWAILLARAVSPVPLAASLRLILLFGIGSLVMRSAGCVVNDMWDRRLDRLVARTAMRPLASGALRMRQAVALLGVLLLAGLVILLQLDRPAQLWGASSLILVGLYPAAKRVTWYPQLVLGFTFGYGAWLGWIAATGKPGLPGLFLYTAAIAWDLGFDTIYGFQDIEDDAVVGIRSTSRRFAHAPRSFLAFCYAVVALGIAFAGLLAGLSIWFWLTLPVPLALLARQVVRLNIANAAGCLTLFRSNRETGVAIAGSLLAGLL